MSSFPQQDLHEAFLTSLSSSVIAHSDPNDKPLEIDLKPPLPHKIRLYIFTATHPPGGRTTGEHKIQLIVPGQKRGERGDFDMSQGRIVILAGYEPDLKVFVLWDSGLYPNFSYSRNVQVKAETVYSAVAGKVATQERRLWVGKETVITCPPHLLARALRTRVELTRQRLIEGTNT